ncbi:hypothetical protein BC332_08336 [Capsicum chinense]|nr:hypothetical protein BC332_08336 [Capsicum chinense]
MHNQKRLKADPPNCGYPGYELDCQKNRVVISLNSKKYYVLEINYHEYLIKAIDPGLEHQTRNCTSLPDYVNRSVPSTSTFARVLTPQYQYQQSGTAVTVAYHDRNVPIIYVNCLAPVNSSHYVETTFCNSTSSNSSQSHSYVTIGQDMSISDLAENRSVQMVAWSLSHGLSGDNTSLSNIHAALTYGFELSWKYSFLCRECEGTCFAEGGGYSCNRCKDEMFFSRHSSFLSLWFLFGLVFLTALVVYKWRRQHLSMYQSIEDFLQIQTNLFTIKYSYSEIRKMTNKFKEKLGEGAYGTVFKGKLRSGPFVAVKVMHKYMTSGQEFIGEVSTIGRIHHVNVEQLIGFCVEGSKRALVYEFMLNERGTVGYMAPELFYKNIGGVSYKADVYSYGMLLMEMAGRRKNTSPFEDHLSQIYFPTWVYDQFNDGNDIEMHASEEDRRFVKKMMIVALWCIQMKPADRPAMNKVVEMLEGDVELLQMPPRPFIAPRDV